MPVKNHHQAIVRYVNIDLVHPVTFWMFGGVVYKNKQARRYGYACAGHARRDVKIRTDNR